MEGVGQGIAVVFFIFFVLGFTVCSGVIYMLEDDRIKSKTRIEPRIELIITNNQPDTLFVYEVK
jgi:hypothetical protein